MVMNKSIFFLDDDDVDDDGLFGANVVNCIIARLTTTEIITISFRCVVREDWKALSFSKLLLFHRDVVLATTLIKVVF
jgi:hypothetical protein